MLRLESLLRTNQDHDAIRVWVRYTHAPTCGFMVHKTLVTKSKRASCKVHRQLLDEVQILS